MEKNKFFYWELPGGRLEFYEDIEEVVIREVKEETSLDIQVLYPISTWSLFKNQSTKIVGITYLSTSKNRTVTHF